MSNQLFANPNNWDTAELGDLISVIAGHGFRKSEYSNSGIKLLQIANVTFQEISWEETAYLPHEYIEHYPKLVLKPGDLVMALNRPILGRRVKFAILSQKDCPAILYQRVGKFIFKSKTIIRDFLYVFMQTDYFYHELKSRLAGSDQPYINPTELVKIRVPVPPLDEQKRIAAIAQKADRLRRTQRYALQLSDTYLQSVFLEMFGNPITNPKGWEVVDLDSQIERIDSGWSPVCEESPRTSSKQWAVLRLGAVTWGIYQPNDNKLLPPGLEPRPELEVQKGDILITRKNTIELVSACALVHQAPPRLMLPDTIFRFCFKKSCELKPEYLWGLFNEKSFRKKIQSLATGTAGSMPNISKEKFLGIVLPLPPLPLQEKFAQIVQKFERLRTQQREGDRQAEHLFQTLLHRAFRGELTPQDSNDEPASVLLEQIRAEQAKAEAEAKAATQVMGNAAEYLGTKAKQQDTEPIQLTLPGME